MKSALVIEGGGMRGIFAAGVLDAFFKKAHDPFDLYIGVSAGACNLASHLAGQYQRNYRIYTNLMTRPDFLSFRKFVRGGHWMDLDWLWETIELEDDLDAESAIKNLEENNKRFLITVTSVNTGRPLYLEPGPDTLSDYLKYSSSVPVMYRGFPLVDGGPVTDGGVGDPVPAIEAYNRGAREIIVIRSRPLSYTKTKSVEEKLSSLFLRRHPELVMTIRKKPAFYMKTIEFIRTPPEDARIIEINPPEDMRTGRTTTDIKSLDHDYHAGLSAGETIINRM